MIDAIDTIDGSAVQALRADVVRVLDDVSGVLDGLRAEIDADRTRRALRRASRLHPKARSVVFAGRDYFGDNLKYAYLAALGAARAQGFDCWYLPFDARQEELVRALGAPCLPADAQQWSAAHVSAALGAAVLVGCDHLTESHHPNPFAAALLAGARQVQLWHGISIKEIGLRNPPPLARMTPYLAEVLASCGDYAAFVGTNAADENEWRRWFSFDRYAPIGYPRNDVLLRTPAGHDLANVDLDTLAAMRAARVRGARAVLYVPTFRDGRPEWIREVGLDALADRLAARGDALVVNLHPYEHWQVEALARDFPRVCFVRAASDLYPLLAEADALVTDYSSLMFDFLLLDRPVLFFRPDHERYVSDSRRLYDARLRERPGPVFDDAGALAAALGDAAALADPAHRRVRRALRERLFDHADAGAGARFVELLLAELERAGAPRR